MEPEPLTDEEIEKHFEEEHKKKQNVRRDRKGRLEKGSMIAKKRKGERTNVFSHPNHCSYFGNWEPFQPYSTIKFHTGELMDNKSMGKGYIWEYVKCI